MKKDKKQKTLVLSKDTLRKLTDEKLFLARGGADLSNLICMTLSCRTCGGTDCI